MGTSCLEDVTTPLPHLEANWLTSLRRYLAKIDASLQIDNAGIPPLEREHDCYIMDQCIQSSTFKPAEIRAINYCRLFLGAVTLSDLTNTTGDRLDHAKLHGKLSLMSHTTRWMVIYQESLSVAQWRIWRRANKLWSTPTGTLHQPLGRWLRDHQSRRIQFCAYAHSGHLVAVRYEGAYQLYKVDPFANSHEVAFAQVRYEDMPRQARPLEVEENTRRRWKIIGVTQRLMLPRPPRHSTFRQYLNSLVPWECEDLLQHVTLTLDPRYSCFELHQSFFAGTDGSVKYNKEGAFGWVVATPAEGDRIANGMGPSRSFKMDSYRAECSGMLSFLRFLVRLLAGYADMYDQWQGVIGTDSQSMLDRLYQPVALANGDDRIFAVMDVMEPEWDLLIEIQATLKKLPRVRLQYVKGHQDDRASYDNLSLLAQLNVDADKRASTYQRLYGAERPFTPMTPSVGVHLVTAHGTITAKLGGGVRKRSTGPGLIAYLKQKNQWSDRVLDNVNWEAHGKALMSSQMKRIHLTKFLHDALPTLAHENKIDGTNRRCKACGHAEETTDHVVRCDAPARTAWRKEWLNRIETFHVQHHTHTRCFAMSLERP